MLTFIAVCDGRLVKMATGTSEGGISEDERRVQISRAIELRLLERKTFPLPVTVYFEDGANCSEIDRITRFLVLFGNREESKAQLDPIENFPFVFAFPLPSSQDGSVILEVKNGSSGDATREVTDSSYGLIFFCDDLNEEKLTAILKKIEDLEVTYRQKYSQLIVTRSLADNIVSSANSSTAVYVLHNPYDERDNPFATFVRRMVAKQEELMETTTKKKEKDATKGLMPDILSSIFHGQRKDK